MTKKFLVHGELIDWRPGTMQFAVKDSTQGWFSGVEQIIISPGKDGNFFKHIAKVFGNRPTNIKINIIFED